MRDALFWSGKVKSINNPPKSDVAVLYCLMRINEDSLKNWIDNFYGHGSWKAKIWFVSYEEPGADVPEDLVERLSFFDRHQRSLSNDALSNLREFYRSVTYRNDGPRAALFSNHFDYRFGPASIPHGIWKNLIAFAEGYRDQPVLDVLTYQREQFVADSNAAEALIPLYPLPSPHNHAWYYSWIDAPGLAFLKTRTGYEAHMYEKRMRTILEQMKKHRPDIVLMYEMSNINALKDSVKAFFPAASFQLVKATKNVIPQHHRANLDGTTLLITTQVPALRHNRKETGFDWQAVGRMSRQN